MATNYGFYLMAYGYGGKDIECPDVPHKCHPSTEAQLAAHALGLLDWRNGHEVRGRTRLEADVGALAGVGPVKPRVNVRVVSSKAVKAPPAGVPIGAVELTLYTMGPFDISKFMDAELVGSTETASVADPMQHKSVDLAAIREDAQRLAESVKASSAPKSVTIEGVTVEGVTRETAGQVARTHVPEWTVTGGRVEEVPIAKETDTEKMIRESKEHGEHVYVCIDGAPVCGAITRQFGEARAKSYRQTRTKRWAGEQVTVVADADLTDDQRAEIASREGPTVISIGTVWGMANPGADSAHG